MLKKIVGIVCIIVLYLSATYLASAQKWVYGKHEDTGEMSVVLLEYLDSVTIEVVVLTNNPNNTFIMSNRTQVLTSICWNRWKELRSNEPFYSNMPYDEFYSDCWETYDLENGEMVNVDEYGSESLGADSSYVRISIANDEFNILVLSFYDKNGRENGQIGGEYRRLFEFFSPKDRDNER